MRASVTEAKRGKIGRGSGRSTLFSEYPRTRRKCQFVQPKPNAALSNKLGYPRNARRHLLAGAPSFMLQSVGLVKREMLQLTKLEGSRSRGWSALVVLLVVCSLTASVATRYSFFRGSSDDTVTKVQKHMSPEPSRQRLMKNAATWIPPVVVSAVLEAPSSYPRIAPAGPPIPSLFFEKSLYNRPPPASESLT